MINGEKLRKIATYVSQMFGKTHEKHMFLYFKDHHEKDMFLYDKYHHKKSGLIHEKQVSVE